MGTLSRIYTASARLQEQPGVRLSIGRRDSRMLHGEPFEIISTKDGWAYGRSILDGYTGWVNEASLVPDDKPVTHFVHSLATDLYLAPDFKLRVSDSFSFLSRVTVDANAAPENGFVKLQDQPLWIFANHLSPIDDLDNRPVDIIVTAMQFHGKTRYQYSERTADGIDCSALVQLALQRNNIPCPRDADQQEPVIGKAVKRPRRGDIVYLIDGPGLHTGIMASSTHIINATARHMAVVVEKFDDMKKNYGGIKSIRRLEF